MSLLGAALLGGAPTANAEVLDLDNGLTVEIHRVNPKDGSRAISVRGRPRVGEYVTQVANVRFPDGNQFELDGEFQPWSFTVTRNQTEVSIQACRPFDFSASKCTKWSTFYPYKNPAPPPLPAPKPAPMPKLPPAPPPAPAPMPKLPPPVTDAITLSFSPPGLGSITATVTNSSDLTAKCTYDATPFNVHRDFTVAPRGSTPLTFSGFNTGISYHVVVSCRDASGKETQAIGHAEQDVTF